MNVSTIFPTKRIPWIDFDRADAQTVVGIWMEFSDHDPVVVTTEFSDSMLCTMANRLVAQALDYTNAGEPDRTAARAVLAFAQSSDAARTTIEAIDHSHPRARALMERTP